MRRGLLGFAIFFGLSLAFMNCAEFSPVASKADLSAQCTEKLREKPLVPFDVATICEDASHYACDRRVFAPGIGNGESRDSQCVAVTGMDEICVPVQVFRYDTSGSRSLDDVDPRAFEPGGEYNREEIHCANTAVTNRSFTVFRGESDSLQMALESAVQSCRKGRVP